MSNRPNESSQRLVDCWADHMLLRFSRIKKSRRVISTSTSSSGVYWLGVSLTLKSTAIELEERGSNFPLHFTTLWWCTASAHYTTYK